MLGELWKPASAKLADRFVAASAPALVFWLGGLLAWLYHEGDTTRIEAATDWLNKQSGPVQVAALVAVLAAVAGSAIVVQRLTFPALRLLEGYWPRSLAPLRRRLVARERKRVERDDEDWQALLPSVLPDRSRADADTLATFARLDQARNRRPASPNRLMPTRTGNMLRAAEDRAYERYGLDAVAVWPRLWLVLPDVARDELTAARTALNSAVAAALWGLLFCAFAPWTMLAVPVGLCVAVLAVKGWIPRRAQAFGELVDSAFDLYRPALYKALRWPLAATPQQERAQGEALASYLWRGSDDTKPIFHAP
jgi:hypothetical protein